MRAKSLERLNGMILFLITIKQEKIGKMPLHAKINYEMDHNKK